MVTPALRFRQINVRGTQSILQRTKALHDTAVLCLPPGRGASVGGTMAASRCGSFLLPQLQTNIPLIQDNCGMHRRDTQKTDPLVTMRNNRSYATRQLTYNGHVKFYAGGLGFAHNSSTAHLLPYLSKT
jgi:hypothetical protein